MSEKEMDNIRVRVFDMLYSLAWDMTGRVDVLFDVKDFDHPLIQQHSIEGQAIILNLDGGATRDLVRNNEGLYFKFALNGCKTEVSFPWSRVRGVRGVDGLLFAANTLAVFDENASITFMVESDSPAPDEVQEQPVPSPRPSLKVVK